MGDPWEPLQRLFGFQVLDNLLDAFIILSSLQCLGFIIPKKGASTHEPQEALLDVHELLLIGGLHNHSVFMVAL